MELPVELLIVGEELRTGGVLIFLPLDVLGVVWILLVFVLSEERGVLMELLSVPLFLITPLFLVFPSLRSILFDRMVLLPRSTLLPERLMVELFLAPSALTLF